jgi:hypothetical protein
VADPRESGHAAAPYLLLILMLCWVLKYIDATDTPKGRSGLYLLRLFCRDQFPAVSTGSIEQFTCI